MNAQEVDLAHLDLVLLGEHSDRYSSNRSNKFLLLIPNSHQPISSKTRRRQRPIQKLPRIIESIGTIVILHIIISEQMIKLDKKAPTSSSIFSSFTLISSQYNSGIGKAIGSLGTSLTSRLPSTLPGAC